MSLRKFWIGGLDFEILKAELLLKFLFRFFFCPGLTRIFLSNLERFSATILGNSFFIYHFIEQRGPL